MKSRKFNICGVEIATSELLIADTGKKTWGRKIMKFTSIYRMYAKFGGNVNKRYLFSCVIPLNFESDGASIPFGIRMFFKPDGPWFEAAAMHDFLYTENAKCPKWLADIIFFVVMRFCNVKFPVACLFWTMVTIFGWTGYHKRKDWRISISGNEDDTAEYEVPEQLPTLSHKNDCIRCGECCKQGTSCVLRPFEDLTYEQTPEEAKICSLLSFDSEGTSYCKVIYKYLLGGYNEDDRSEINNEISERFNKTCDTPKLKELYKIRNRGNEKKN